MEKNIACMVVMEMMKNNGHGAIADSVTRRRCKAD